MSIPSRLVVLSGAITCLQLGALAAATERSRAGYEEIYREQIGDETYIYWAPAAVATRFNQVNQRLEILDKAIPHTRNIINGWQRSLPDYLKQLDEWVEMDQTSRKELRQAGAHFGCELMLASLHSAAEHRTQVSQQQLQDCWREFQQSPLNSESFRRALEAQGRGTLRIRQWESFQQMTEDLHHLVTTAEAIGAAHREEYLQATSHVMRLALQDPRLRILVSDLEFFASAVYAQMATRAAQSRVDQLSQLGTERLQALKADTALYCRQIDERKKLLGERELILRDARKRNHS